MFDISVDADDRLTATNALMSVHRHVHHEKPTKNQILSTVEMSEDIGSEFRRIFDERENNSPELSPEIDDLTEPPNSAHD